jgi:hypothetical protein
MTQYLYLIKCQQYYKIGVANDVQSRLAQLSTGNPFELEPLTVSSFNNASVVEAALHQCFASKRTRGEWFALTQDDLATFDKIVILLGGGGAPDMSGVVNDSEIEEAEEIQKAVLDDGEWDYAAMFAEGWRMEVSGNGRGSYTYWSWRKGSFRKGSTTKGYIYGGRIADLPHPIEEMRRIYRDGMEPITEGVNHE